VTGGLAGPCDGACAAAAQRAAARYPRLTLAATILGSSVAFIDGSVVNVALPSLARDLSASPSELTWAINAYLLPLGALTLLGGGLGDRFGRRRLFLIGLAMFTLASIVCAAAPSLMWFLAGRGIQGLGAALLMPNSLAILGGAIGSVDTDHVGAASGFNSAVARIAGLVATALLGFVFAKEGSAADFIGSQSSSDIKLPIQDS
jgi:MFS family permease